MQNSFFVLYIFCLTLKCGIMRKNYSHSIAVMLTVLLCCVVATVSGQSAYHYSNGFESTADAAAVTVVSSAGQPTQWVVGSATSYSGTKSLYVSTTADGAVAGYDVNTAGITMAYITVTLPVGLRCAVSFDYKFRGSVPNDVLSVCVVDNPTLN